MAPGRLLARNAPNAPCSGSNACNKTNQTLQARIRSLEQRLFGRKTEHAATLPDAAAPTSPPQPPRPRGQRRGRPGPQRRDYTHLPVVEETLDVPTDQQHCPQCGQAFAPFPTTDDSTVLEVEVRAHRRLIRRRRYRPTCGCGCNAGIITAPPPPKVLPKSLLGVSIWVRVLLDKYLFYRPTYRLLEDLATDEACRCRRERSPTACNACCRLWSRCTTPWSSGRGSKPCGTPTARAGWCTPAWKARSATAGICGSSTAATWWCSCWRAGPRPRRAGGASGSPGRRHPGGGSLCGLQGVDAGEGRPDRPGLLLGTVRRDFVEAARSWPALERWGLGLGGADRRSVSLQRRPAGGARGPGRVRSGR